MVPGRINDVPFIKDPFERLVPADDPVLAHRTRLQEDSHKTVHFLHVIRVDESHDMLLPAGEIPEGNPVECFSRRVYGENRIILRRQGDHDFIHGMEDALKPFFDPLQIDPGLASFGDIRQCTEYCRAAPALDNADLHLDDRFAILFLA